MVREGHKNSVFSSRMTFLDSFQLLEKLKKKILCHPTKGALGDFIYKTRKIVPQNRSIKKKFLYVPTE